VARVVVAESAQADLNALVLSHSLPASTRARVRTSLRPLATFPLLGPALTGRWHGFRFILGPWPWMLLVYLYDGAADRGVRRHGPGFALCTRSDIRRLVTLTSPRAPSDAPYTWCKSTAT